MSARTGYDLTDGIATITMDDGKVNAVAPELSAELLAHFDQAERDGAVVILTGRPGRFSAGFDLRVPGDQWGPMMMAGAEVAKRMLGFPRPVVVACTGHAIAMGGFLLLAGDHRIGVRGDAQIGLNEVKIGLTLPWFGIELAKHRLPNQHFDRCTVTGPLFGPEEAVTYGFLDELVDPGDLTTAARAKAEELAGLNEVAHANTKLRIREDVIAGVQRGIDAIATKPVTEW